MHKSRTFWDSLCSKWASTYVATGCTVSPPTVIIGLGENWTTGGVKDRYIKYKRAGDQFLGMYGSGLPILLK